MRACVTVFVAVVFAVLGAVSSAAAHGRHKPRMAKPVVSVSLVSGGGMALPHVNHKGRTFVAGERGKRYAVRLTNNAMQRVEVVVAVDGRDVVSGKRADVVKQRGYVIEPGQTIEIDGYRQSMDRVAAFRFSSVADSYAARRGSKRTVGRIAVAVFKEKRRMMPRRGMKKAPATKAPAKMAPPTSRSRQELGTEYGESRMSTVRSVTFERASKTTPDFRTALFYDSAEALTARGIPIGMSPIVADGFAPPPGARR